MSNTNGTTPEWVSRSNQNAQELLKILARFNPEAAGRIGVPGVDENIIDLQPGYDERARAAVVQASQHLQQLLAAEADPHVRQDLQIMIKAANDHARGIELDRKYLIPYINVPEVVFQGIRALLDDQIPASRRPAALVRLRRYAGIGVPAPLTELAEQRTRERLNVAGLQGPYRGELEKNFGNEAAYIGGIGQLFEKYKIEGYQEPYNRLKQQLAGYHTFLSSELLPKARTDFRLPREIYAFHLERNGILMQPDALAAVAHTSFNDIQNEMMALAPEVARQKGITATDYRDVIRALKKQQWPGQSILPNYERRIHEIEHIIRRERLVSLPNRPLKIELATEAETAAVPAPHMVPPPLIGNTGQHGIFKLPLRTAPPPGSKSAQSMQYDDFTFDAAAWTLTAHEGRPGHELQFDSMVENGVSIARAIFALNSVNVEGWGLYSEAILQPFMPPDGQLISMQHRLMRAARAFLDPELQSGKITPERARHILTDDVVLSDALANEEVERYMFWAPAQAPSYFYGYTELMRLRADSERVLGPSFEQLKFHDFVLSQGALPPPLLRSAVFEQFAKQPVH